MITGKAGIYLIVNLKTMKIYLGGSCNLAQRKGEHKQNLTKSERSTRLNAQIREDLKNGSLSDFYFVPLVVFDLSKVIGFETASLLSINKQIAEFLDLNVEKYLLEEFLSPDSNYQSFFYNLTTIGAFQEENTFGGSPKSGTLWRFAKKWNPR